MIQIYSVGNTNFEKNGDKVLFPTKAITVSKKNTDYHAELTHPIDSDGRWRYIVEGAVVKMPSYNGDQLFRVSKKDKSRKGITATLYPIFYDSKNDVFLTELEVSGNGQTALNSMLAGHSKYSAYSDISDVKTKSFVYKNFMQALNGDDSSFIKIWGGEIEFDNYQVRVVEKLGTNRGVEVRYRKNTPENGAKETIDMSEVATRIYPVGYNGIVMTDNGYVDSPLINSYPIVYSKTIQFNDVKMESDVYEGAEEEGVTICKNQEELDEALRKKCEEQFEKEIDKPKVTLSISMVTLRDKTEYKNYEVLETVWLGDEIKTIDALLGIEATKRVIELEYDSIKKKISNVVIGDEEKTSTYFNDVTSKIESIGNVIREDGSLVAEKVKGFIDATYTQMRLQETIAKKLDILAVLMENLDPESPLYGAIGLGTQGVQISKLKNSDGTWNWQTALTANGLDADIIRTGLISDKTAKNFWNLDTGDFSLSATATVGDQTIDDYIDSKSDAIVNNFINTIFTPNIENLQKQIDGQIETFYYDYEPTLSNIPASEWITGTERAKHEGDLFYWKSKGYAYRFFNNNGTWEWSPVQDTDVVKALTQAAQAQDTADSKRRVFVSTPAPPYDVGDLWMQGANGDILTCKVSRQSGNYVYSDWKKENKYTDDSAVNDLNTTLNQQEIFNRLTNNGQTQGIYLQNGKLYINADYIKAGTLVADLIKAGVLSDSNGKNRWDFNNGIFSLDGNVSMNVTGQKDFVYLEYDSNDYGRLRDILGEKITPTVEDYEKYDIDGNGRLTALDFVKVNKLIMQQVEKYSLPLQLEINGNSQSGMIKTRNVFIGLDGIHSKNIDCESIYSKEFLVSDPSNPSVELKGVTQDINIGGVILRIVNGIVIGVI